MLNRAIMVFACCLTNIGCSEPINHLGDESFVSIGTVDGGDTETQDIIESVLATEQIECYFDGSVLYDLHVKKRDVTSALELIKRSRELQGKNIELNKE